MAKPCPSTSHQWLDVIPLHHPDNTLLINTGLARKPWETQGNAHFPGWHPLPTSACCYHRPASPWLITAEMWQKGQSLLAKLKTWSSWQDKSRAPDLRLPAEKVTELLKSELQFVLSLTGQYVLLQGWIIKLIGDAKWGQKSFYHFIF